MDARILSEHPVSDPMRATVAQCLRVCMLYADRTAASGSGCFRGTLPSQIPPELAVKAPVPAQQVARRLGTGDVDLACVPQGHRDVLDALRGPGAAA